MQADTPREAFELLLAGNHRFVAGAPEHPTQDAARRAEAAPSQRPFAGLFGCSDSRLAAEIIFDRGLGDLFVVRTAGHVMAPEVIGSIEFGADVLECPLVVVLGQEACGAVGTACAALEDGTSPAGYVRDVVERVTPSVLAARDRPRGSRPWALSGTRSRPPSRCAQPQPQEHARAVGRQASKPCLIKSRGSEEVPRVA
ncbi:hypothetical protein E1264_20095 [Actinomadura sp. KC216]|uniref:carbonic anhydrase n=1 Tax=Actinomadura sp. KC216 TaxID=2530370 RepID=UPI00104C028E|nr:hypothetical protein E1264_20095 [Actinomadura sp. KC216]